MKFQKIIAGAVIFAAMNPGGAFATISTRECTADTVCQSAVECKNANAISGKKYCCPTCYKTVSKTTCPSGYSITEQTNQFGTTTVCARTATDAGSDDAGYLVQNYGTCSPTTNSTTQDCYTSSETGIIDSKGLQTCLSTDLSIGGGLI